MHSKRACASFLFVATGLAGLWLLGCLWFGDKDGVLGLFSLRVFVVNLAISCLALASTYIALGPSREVRHQRVLKVALGMSSAAACLGLLELPALAGWVDYRLVFSMGKNPNDRVNPRSRLDPELIFVHLPNDHFLGRIRGNLALDYELEGAQHYDVDVRYDRNGFRNERQIDKADVVVIGDSFVEAALVPFDRIASSRLAGSLGVTVLNLGHIKYGPQQELAVLGRYGLQVQPRVVVWMLFEGNDLDDYEIYRATMANWEQYVSSTHSFLRRSWSRNALHALPKVPWLARKDAQLAYRCSGTLKAPGEASGEKMYFRYAAAPLSSRELVSLDAVQMLIHEASQGCAEHQSRFLLAFVPIKYRVYRDLLEIGPDTHLAQWQVSDLPERLERWCASVGIPYLDLTPPLTAASRSGTLTYFLDDTHWTAWGNATAAKAIAELIGAQGWLR